MVPCVRAIILYVEEFKNYDEATFARISGTFERSAAAATDAADVRRKENTLVAVAESCRREPDRASRADIF
jgi:hypothetical protein